MNANRKCSDVLGFMALLLVACVRKLNPNLIRELSGISLIITAVTRKTYKNHEMCPPLLHD